MSEKVKLQVHHVRFFEYQPLPINCIALSLDKAAVSRSDGSVQILSTSNNWVQEQTFPGGDDSSIEALVWCQQRLFAAGLGGHVVELDLDTQSTKNSVSSNAGPVWCMTGNNDETQLAAGTEDGCVVLFNIEDELQFLRFFGKQEGRILSIAWYSNPEGDNIIITGAANNIRQWSVNSGQPISRMTLGHTTNKDTLVWCLTVTQDFTIITGDSRGFVTFWNGKLSTQMKTFHCHKQDVLCLALSQDQSTVYSGGVDSSVFQFSCFSPGPNSDHKRWVHQLLHSYHTHDVRSLAYCDSRKSVVSGGLDCVLQLAILGENKHVKCISPFSSGFLVDVDKEHNLVLLQYPKHMELWRLGAAEPPDANVKGILPLSRNPVKLIELKAREGQQITCSALSSHGLMAFSDLQQMRLYRYEQRKADSPTPELSLERVKLKLMQPARLMTLTPSGDYLIAVQFGSGLTVINTKTGLVQHKVKTDSPVHLVRSSPDSQHIAYANVNREVNVLNLTSGEVVCRCPMVSSQVSAIRFAPNSCSLFIVYCMQKIVEVDFVSKEYTAWCHEHRHAMANNWLLPHKTLKDVLFPPNDPHHMYLYADNCLIAVDRRKQRSQHLPFRKSFKYKYLVHADFLNDGSLVAVERPASTIEEQLPPSLKQKKFGLA